MSTSKIVWRDVYDEWRKEWRVGFAVLLGTATAMAAWNAVSSLFVQPLQTAFGWSKAEIAFAHNASFLAAAISPSLGRLIDRVGVRRVLVPGLILTALCYCALGLMNGSLVNYYVAYTAFAIIGMSTTGLAYTRVVSATFVKSLGFSLAIARVGVALAGAAMPPLAFAVIANYGWRAGFFFMAGMMLAVSLPLALAFIGRDGGRDKPGAIVKPKAAPIPWRVLLGNWRVIAISLAAAFNYAPTIALLSQFQPLLVEKGFGAGDAAGMISLVGIAVLIGALVSGVLVDRFWAPMVACIFTLGPAGGCLLLMMDSPGTLTVFCAVIMVGLAKGAEIDIVAFMIARYFGLRGYATIYGIGVLVIAAFGAIGTILIAVLHDRTLSYNPGLLAAAISFALSSACYLAMGRYPAQPIYGGISRSDADESEPAQR